jgi:hypothetical protein
MLSLGKARELNIRVPEALGITANLALSQLMTVVVTCVSGNVFYLAHQCTGLALVDILVIDWL